MRRERQRADGVAGTRTHRGGASRRGVEYLARRRAARACPGTPCAIACSAMGSWRAGRHPSPFRLDRQSAREDEARRDGPASPVRWQRTRVTLLHAQVLDADATAAEHERARMIEDIARKASAFGGRIIELGPASVKAAFGLDLIEDAARHAAHAAFAVQRAVGGSTRHHCEVRIALHTEEMLVGRLEDRVELDADARRSAEGLLDGSLASNGRRSRSSRPRRPSRSWSGDSTSSRSPSAPEWPGLARHRARRCAIGYAHAVRVTRPRNRRARGSAAAGRRRPRSGGARWPATRASARRACCTSSIGGPADARPGSRDRPCPLAARCRFTRSSTCSSARSPFQARRLRRGDWRSDRPHDRAVW